MGIIGRHPTGSTIVGFILLVLILSALLVPDWARPLDAFKQEQPLHALASEIFKRAESTVSKGDTAAHDLLHRVMHVHGIAEAGIGIEQQRDIRMRGAVACVVVPSFYDAHPEPGGWQWLARWIHEHLSFSTLYFFPTYWAVNIGWHERPQRRIDSYAEPKGRWMPN